MAVEIVKPYVSVAMQKRNKLYTKKVLLLLNLETTRVQVLGDIFRWRWYAWPLLVRPVSMRCQSFGSASPASKIALP